VLRLTLTWRHNQLGHLTDDWMTFCGKIMIYAAILAQPLDGLYFRAWNPQEAGWH
jgi:hypothetical protein